MGKAKIKYLVGLYAAAMSIMGMLVPVPILAQVAATFPDQNIAAVQMTIGIIPLFMALAALLVSSLLAQRVLKKTTLVVAHCVVIAAGLSIALFMHGTLAMVLVGSALIGLGIGCVQNCTDALIADTFEGKQRSFVMGFFATFVAMGGVLWVNLSGFLGAQDWSHSYLAYLAMIPLVVLEAVFLPKGHLEPKRTVNVFANMPREVLIVTAAAFVFACCFQLFNTNVSLIVELRGFGGVGESAMATTAVSLAGIVAGMIVGVLFMKFKNLAMPLVWGVALVGLVLALVAPNLITLCVAGFLASLGKEAFVPLEGNFNAGNSSNAGRAFNLAFGAAGINLGMAVSPLFFQVASTPFGNGIDAKFIIGIVICAAVIAFGLVHYRKLTPAQVEEQKRLESEQDS